MNQIKCKNFSELNIKELYEILKLRIEVFVVEQNCVYQDLDSLDPLATHLWMEDEKGILSYLRILPENTRFKEVSLGRLVSKKEIRSKGFAKELVQEALKLVKKERDVSVIRISAQKYLEKYYESLGFQTDSEEYLEDGIPHVEMVTQLN